MTRQLKRRYPGPSGMFALSLVCHLALLLIVAKWQFLPAQPVEVPVTYVDMVTLPVASPQSGTPAPPAEAAPKPPVTAAAPTPPSPPAAMALPATNPKAKVQPAPKMKVQEPAAAPAPTARVEKPKSAAPPPVDDAREFRERLAKVERIAEEKRQAEVLERLKSKAAGKVGMPGATGTEAGSDYASYVQSRLKDALREVMASDTKSPMVIAVITIGPDGRIADYRVEKNSGDPLFDDAVVRAVTLAGKSLTPPPGGAQFRHKFRFRPEGVGVR